MEEEDVVGKISIGRAPMHALGDLQRNIQHYYDMAALALTLAETVPDVQLVLPGSNTHVQLAKNEDKSIETVRGELINWILRAGMRDSVEAVNGFLVDLRQQCATAALISKSGGRVQWSEFQQAYERETEKFSKLGLPKKIRDDKTALKDCFGVSVDEKFINTVISLNDARNCLVHRAGRVQQADINDPALQKLVVTWFGCDLRGHSERGVRKLIVGESRTEADEVVEFDMLGQRRREFALNEPVVFTAQEFSEIFLTFYYFGLETTKSAEQYFRSLGLLQNTLPA